MLDIDRVQNDNMEKKTGILYNNTVQQLGKGM
jgi:hypothetical protein